ncbi:1-acyl-sn-glycerol-3-phosphate acyltransferase [Actinotalea sp. M2MS4P-6]|uniref:1-acyl-sn-glycerol-3-phosphate acyltransferase n=1 Tax=Actinotalea sp. M2MS4P-6 TaxID=2983762 RepID=UPI0021E4D8B0|nr:1-acyl-sn-glycerol-3-phosphate acyltransferase [Actinotalea sp. M2MS4P-6]MCV2393775.1 1-acyl-sn-glycerol-3-phosphate acyltransferase [Actinotalea sp. M2MS4P-6]
MARRIAAIVARLVYRDVEVSGWSAPPSGPVITVANHFGGFADAILLIYLAERFPRIVARDVIWTFPVVGSLMRWIGAIPVHRKVDKGGGRTSNDDMFRSCYDALGEGGSVLIFPEGVTQDDPFIAPVKTGAARIALGARAAGAEGLVIQPVGIHYADKAAFRSRVLVVWGEPIDLDDVGGDLESAGEPLGADNRAAVGDLTERISAHLRAAAPDYGSWEQARALQLGAEVALRRAASPADPVDDVPLALVDELGSRLAGRPDPVRSHLQEQAELYRAALSRLRTDDYALTGPQHTGRDTVADLVIALLLLPYALVGAALGLVPYALTQATRLIPAAPAMRATIMPLVAFVVFVAEWVWVSVATWTSWGRWEGAVVALLAPAFLAATVALAERAITVWRTWRRWWFSRRRGGPVDEARALRDGVLAAVRAAL